MECFSILMEHQCDVYASSSARDAGGGSQTVYTLRATGKNFLLNVAPASEQDRFDQKNLVGPVTGATFYTGVQRGDKLIVTAGPSLVGASLRVNAIKDQPGVDALGFEEILHIGCDRIA